MPHKTAKKRAAYMRAYRARQAARRLEAGLPEGARLAPQADLPAWIAARLVIPTGPLAGRPFALAPWQAEFLRRAMGPGIREAGLSVARKNGKSGAIAALLLAHLAGPGGWPQWRGVVTSLTGGLAKELLDAVRLTAEASELPQVKTYKTPYPGRVVCGTRRLDFLAADRATGHGIGCDLAVVDEAGLLTGNQRPLWGAMLSSLSGRDGRLLAISIRGSSPMFAEMAERAGAPSVHWTEYAAPSGCDLEDEAAWAAANPGLATGIKSVAYMRDAAARALAIPSEGASFRAYDLNQQLSPSRELLCDPPDWSACETEDLPPRAGPCAVGIDLGGSASMTAAAAYWPLTGRMETWGAFPSEPDLRRRGIADRVGELYCEMSRRGELTAYPGRVTPVVAFLGQLGQRLAGQQVAFCGADRYRRAEALDALAQAEVRWPMAWRGVGASATADGSHDVRAFQTAVLKAKIRHRPSLLVASAIAEATIRRDAGGNPALEKARSAGRIDVLQAATIAVGGAAAAGLYEKRPTRWTTV